MIAGSAKGRRLEAARGRLVRRRPIASGGAVQHPRGRIDLRGAVLDLFAAARARHRGAGRGARTFVEQNRRRAGLTANLERCAFADRAQVVAIGPTGAGAPANEGRRFDGVLMDPPYGRDLAAQALGLLAGGALLSPGGWVVAEHHLDDALADAYGNLRLTTRKRYGKTSVSLYLHANSPDDVAET